MRITNRVIFQDDTVFNDFTVAVTRFKLGEETFSYTTAEDFIYYGAFAPFNHFYLKLGSTVNLVSADMTMEYWDGNEWHAVVELFDETDALSQSGFVTWTPDKDERWLSDDTDDMEGSGLEDDLTIYEMYWVRISFDQTLTTNIDLSWIGQKFSDDTDLGGEYPQLNTSKFLTGFESGKTDWEEQHVIAAETIQTDMMDAGAFDYVENILDREQFKGASLQKVAELAYARFGEDYEDDREKAGKEYFNRLNKIKTRRDRNSDGRLDSGEARIRSRYFSR